MRRRREGSNTAKRSFAQITYSYLAMIIPGTACKYMQYVMLNCIVWFLSQVSFYSYALHTLTHSVYTCISVQILSGLFYVTN